MDYTQRIELQMQEVSKNDKGDVSTEWRTVWRGFARAQALGSSEFWQASAVQQECTVKLFLRWHEAFKSATTRNSRILWNGRAYDIKQIDDVGFRHDEIVIKAVMRDG